MPSPFIDNAVATESKPGNDTSVQHPWTWLGIILLFALVVRCFHIDGVLFDPSEEAKKYNFIRLKDDLQQDEYGPLFAVADRQGLIPGFTPAAADPVVAVPTLSEVRERSILPYGIENPYPLYHYLLHLVLRILPIAAWSLRLPSLLAGLGCVVGVYLVCRRLIGAEVALIAALLTAVDPMQIATSAMARPYAVANLACVGSFLFLLLIQQARTLMGSAWAAVAYGLCMALLGYLNPLLLFVGMAHAGLAAYWFLVGTEQQPGAAIYRHDRSTALPRALCWLAGCILALLLLVPELGYILEVQRFAREHRAYWKDLQLHSLMWTFLLHNSGFLLALLVISVAGFIIRRSTEGLPISPEDDADNSASGIDANQNGETTTAYSEGSQEPTRTEDPEPAILPDNPDFLWLGRCWIFLPQLFPFVLSYAFSEPMFLSRYLSYTMLGGSILLAHWATRSRSRELRLGITAALVLTIFLWGLTDLTATRTGLITRSGYRQIFPPPEPDKPDSWREGDVILVRSGFLEADLLSSIPEPNRTRIRASILAPYTILPEGTTPKPVMVLSYSNYRSDQVKTHAGQPDLLTDFYNEELADRLRGYKRFWYRGLPLNTDGSSDEGTFLDCFLPWLADAIDSDLSMARNRLMNERNFEHFEVRKGLRADEGVAGLQETKVTDFKPICLIRRQPASQVESKK